MAIYGMIKESKFFLGGSTVPHGGLPENHQGIRSELQFRGCRPPTWAAVKQKTCPSLQVKSCVKEGFFKKNGATKILRSMGITLVYHLKKWWRNSHVALSCFYTWQFVNGDYHPVVSSFIENQWYPTLTPHFEGTPAMPTPPQEIRASIRDYSPT